MVTKLLNHRSTQVMLTSLILLGTLICVFTPNYFLFKLGSNFANQIMLGYLVLGMVFLILRQPQLMFTSFACCVGLCVQLKYSSNSDLKHPARTNDTTLKVAHFNVSGSNDEYSGTIDAMLQTDADLISIQEITPDWKDELETHLKPYYKYRTIIDRFDTYGIAVYSRYPLLNLDTFYFEDIPNIMGSVRTDNRGKRIYFISSHTTAPLFSSAYEKMKEHLKVIAERAHQIKAPIITLGDYHAPPWWTEIQELKDIARLNDSRRSARQTFSRIFQTPVDYIFYSKDLKCVEFETISSVTSQHLGIQGTYQFNMEVINAKKTSQKF